MSKKYDIMIIGSFIVIAVGIFGAMILYFEQERTTEIPTTGFPNCLRINECKGVTEFAEIPQNEIDIISENYINCIEGYSLVQTCEIRVHQDIERFFEQGSVKER